MNNSIKLLWILSALSAFVLLGLMEAYEAETEITVNNILFIFSIIFVAFWVLRIGAGIFGSIFGIFFSSIKPSKPRKANIKKSKRKQKKNEDKELTFIQFIIFYPMVTFGMLVFFGLAMNGFKP